MRFLQFYIFIFMAYIIGLISVGDVLNSWYVIPAFAVILLWCIYLPDVYLRAKILQCAHVFLVDKSMMIYWLGESCHVNLTPCLEGSVYDNPDDFALQLQNALYRIIMGKYVWFSQPSIHFHEYERGIVKDPAALFQALRQRGVSYEMTIDMKQPSVHVAETELHYA
jgi:hypothetical protein